MFFGRARKKKDAAKQQKKKWELDMEEPEGKEVGLDASIECSACQQDLSGIGLFCVSCDRYFCCPHFADTHQEEEQVCDV